MGCFNEKKVQPAVTKIEDEQENQKAMYSNEDIEIYSPKPSETVLTLEFTLSGKVLKNNVPYFFYQVEDGHGYVSEGMVEVNEDNTFSTNIEISNPTNSAGTITFYLDSDNDKIFNLEENVNEQFGQMMIEFASNIQVPLSPLSPSKSKRFVTDEEFYQALKMLKPEFADHVIVKEIFTKMDPEINQMKIDDKNQYITAWWTNNTDFSSMIVFRVTSSETQPIYCETWKRIESVKLIGNDYLDNPLIEIAIYGASGSFSGQWVNLLMLQNDTVKKVWEYQTIANDSHPSDEKGVMEYTHMYSTYLIIPEYMRRFPEHRGPAIHVNGTMETIHVDQNEKVISRQTETNQKRFIWNARVQIFVEQDGFAENESNIIPVTNIIREHLVTKTSEFISPETLTVKQVKEYLGEPTNVEEYPEAHGSGNVIELTYDEASFTFNKHKQKETLKWYTIKSPFFTTQRGITVGLSKSDVINAYGKNYDIYIEDDKTITIGEKVGISFKLKEGKVREIYVWFMYE